MGPSLANSPQRRSQEMKQEKEPLHLSLFKAAILTGLTACSPQPSLQSPTLEVSFRVSATVHHVEDVANSQGSNIDLIFPNLPVYRRGEPQKHIVVPRSEFFEAGCNGRIVLTEKGEEVNTQGFTSSVSDADNILYLFPPDADDPRSFTLDYNRVLKVDRGKYDGNLIEEGVILIDGEVVKRRTFTKIDSTGAGLGEMIEAVKYQAGPHQILCTFKTRDGKTYQDTAKIEIVDNRV